MTVIQLPCAFYICLCVFTSYVFIIFFLNRLLKDKLGLKQQLRLDFKNFMSMNWIQFAPLVTSQLVRFKVLNRTTLLWLVKKTLNRHNKQFCIQKVYMKTLPLLYLKVHGLSPNTVFAFLICPKNIGTFLSFSYISLNQKLLSLSPAWTYTASFIEHFSTFSDSIQLHKSNKTKRFFFELFWRKFEPNS